MANKLVENLNKPDKSKNKEGHFMQLLVRCERGLCENKC